MDISAEYVHQLNNDNTYTGNTIDAIKIDHGYVTGTVTWRNLPVPYHVVSLVYCGADDLIGVLIIEPGTTLMMDYNAQFAIGSQARGGFIADGTSEQIKFISLQDTPAHGDWGNIYFLWDADDDSCIIKNCKLEYGGRQVDGIIRIRDALPTIVDDSIGYSGAYGIFLQRETPNPQELEDNNTFYNNTSGNVYGP
ncbi:MAG: hypothetical protein GY855_14320 [candidate division Zixibacteria bacterium]|nr:hypothetical protein [candidate division Zixibacteria bacterium]